MTIMVRERARSQDTASTMKAGYAREVNGSADRGTRCYVVREVARSPQKPDEGVVYVSEHGLIGRLNTFLAYGVAAYRLMRRIVTVRILETAVVVEELKSQDSATIT